LSDGWTALDHFALRVGLSALRCRWCDARFYRFVVLPERVKQRLFDGNMLQLAMRVLSGRPLPGARKPMPLLAAPSDPIRYVVRAMPPVGAQRADQAQRTGYRTFLQQPPPRRPARPDATILDQDPGSPLRHIYQVSANRRLLGDGQRRSAGAAHKRLFCVLLLDDDPSVRRLFNRLLSREGYMVEEASDLAAATAELRVMLPDVMVVNLSKSRDEENAVKTFRKAHPELTLVVLSENASVENVDPPVQPQRLLYLARPCRVSNLISVIDDVAAQAPPPKPVVLAAVYTA
jgi:ActR/RegA family two-component response regulator